MEHLRRALSSEEYPERKYTGPSLKQKLKDHYDERDFSVKHAVANAYGVSFFWYLVFSLSLTKVLIEVPKILARYSYDYSMHFYYGFAALVVFLLIQIIINWVLCSVKQMSQVRGTSPLPLTEEQMQDGWDTCIKCQVNIPPRAFHCKHCKICQFKRDHHCFFTGNCISYYNQRYFIVWLFYTSIGLSIFIAVGLLYMDIEKPIFSGHIISYIPPITLIQTFMGQTSWWFCYCMLQMYFSGASLLVTTWFFFWQITLIWHGQTTYEGFKGSKKYNISPEVNFRTVFGSWWLFNFIFPMPTFQEGNPYLWETNQRAE